MEKLTAALAQLRAADAKAVSAHLTWPDAFTLVGFCAVLVLAWWLVGHRR